MGLLKKKIVPFIYCVYFLEGTDLTVERYAWKICIDCKELGNGFAVTSVTAVLSSNTDRKISLQKHDLLTIKC